VGAYVLWEIHVYRKIEEPLPSKDRRQNALVKNEKEIQTSLRGFPPHLCRHSTKGQILGGLQTLGVKFPRISDRTQDGVIFISCNRLDFPWLTAMQMRLALGTSVGECERVAQYLNNSI